MAANVAVAQDPVGNLEPNKDKSTERIDGIVATIMAIRRAMNAQLRQAAADLHPGRGADSWTIEPDDGVPGRQRDLVQSEPGRRDPEQLL